MYSHKEPEKITHNCHSLMKPSVQLFPHLVLVRTPRTRCFFFSAALFLSPHLLPTNPSAVAPVSASLSPPSAPRVGLLGPLSRCSRRPPMASPLLCRDVLAGQLPGIAGLYRAAPGQSTATQAAGNQATADQGLLLASHCLLGPATGAQASTARKQQHHSGAGVY
jgi:hypothetical protein